MAMKGSERNWHAFSHFVARRLIAPVVRYFRSVQYLHLDWVKTCGLRPIWIRSLCARLLRVTRPQALLRHQEQAAAPRVRAKVRHSLVLQDAAIWQRSR